MVKNDTNLDESKEQMTQAATTTHSALNKAIPQKLKNKFNNAMKTASKKTAESASAVAKSGFSKALAFASNPANSGTIILGIIVILMLSLICVVSPSMLSSTDNLKKSADDFFKETLKKSYEDAEKSLKDNAISFVSQDMRENVDAENTSRNGYRCGENLNGEWSEDGHTLTITSDGETVKLNTTPYREEKWGDFPVGEKVPLPEGSPLIDLIEKETDEERMSHATACSISINAEPSFEDSVQILMAYVSSVNGAFDMIAQPVYEEGRPIKDGAEFRLYASNDEDLQVGFSSTEEYEENHNETANRYQSISSKEFQDDFKAFVNKKNHDYKVFSTEFEVTSSDGMPHRKYTMSTEEYSTLYKPIFFAPVAYFWDYDKEYHPLNETPTYYVKQKEIPEKDENGQQWYWRISPDGNTKTRVTEFEKYQLEQGDIDNNIAPTTDTFEEIVNYALTFYVTYPAAPEEFDIPILYDMSEYRRRQINNTINAFTETGIDETDANDIFDNLVGKYFDSYIQGYGLEDVYERMQPYIGIGGFVPDEYGSGHPFMGASSLYLTGKEGYPGEVRFTGNHPDWEAIKYHGDNPYDWGQIYGDAMSTMYEWMQNLEDNDLISFRYGTNGQRFWCTEYAQAYFYSIYGGYSWYENDMINTNACDMAAQLVNSTGKGLFDFYSTPVAGAVVSLQNSGAGHVAVIDRVWYEGEDIWISVSDGNVHQKDSPYAGARIQREMSWKAYQEEISKSFDGMVMAGPIEGILD